MSRVDELRSQIREIRVTCRFLCEAIRSCRANYYALHEHHKTLKEQVEKLERQLVKEEGRIKVIPPRTYKRKEPSPEDLTESEIERMIEELSRMLEEKK